MKNNDIKALLIAVNASGNFVGEKYPIGNRELTAKLQNLEHDRKIEFDPYWSKWVLKRKK